ncbi:MAG: energy-coupling factor transporter transmembrane component T [Bacillota bacterium]|nr:energy-coupling factor transporter transmembrane component T [Bacillota bacterium]
MLKDLTLGQYIETGSLVHHLDSRLKILATAGLITLLFLVRDLRGYLVLAVFLAGAVFLARLPFRLVLKGIRPLVWFILLTVVLNILMVEEGPLLWSAGPLRVTAGGLERGIFMGVRLVLLILITSLLTLTTSPITLTDGLEHLLAPFKRVGVPAHELAMMMTIALRFIPTLLDETDRIMKAQMARGADFEHGRITERIRNLIPLLVPLFISAFRRADELAMAMEARCYRGGEGRTRLRELKWTRRDYLAAVLVAVFLVVTAYLF